MYNIIKDVTALKKVFVDGKAGTTGLRIYERLQKRDDIVLLSLPEEKRKDPQAREEMLNEADFVFLCLPDDAATEAVELVKNDSTVIIDTSTAHRTADDWTYGFPEINGLKEKIKTSKRIANPGCHASGFISLAAPLAEAGIIKKDTALTCFSITGYSGGGKKMIAEYEAPENKEKLLAPRQYGISQMHKHLPEMRKICGLEKEPVFCPIVSSFYAGMEVTVTLAEDDMTGKYTVEDIKNVYREYYKDGLVGFAEKVDENGFISASKYEGRDDMCVSAVGCEGRILLVSLFDNLGKGASGAAIQNMNLVLGIDESTGLII